MADEKTEKTEKTVKADGTAEGAASGTADAAAASQTGVGSEPERVDTLSYETSVIEKIVALACNEVEGIASMKGNLLNTITETIGRTSQSKGVDATLDDKSVTLNLSVVLEYGVSAVDVFNALREVIGEHLGRMTDLRIRAINVRIVDIDIAQTDGAAQPDQTA